RAGAKEDGACERDAARQGTKGIHDAAFRKGRWQCAKHGGHPLSGDDAWSPLSCHLKSRRGRPLAPAALQACCGAASREYRLSAACAIASGKGTARRSFVSRCTPTSVMEAATCPSSALNIVWLTLITFGAMSLTRDS